MCEYTYIQVDINAFIGCEMSEMVIGAFICLLFACYDLGDAYF